MNLIDHALSAPGLFVIALNLAAILSVASADRIERVWHRLRHERRSQRRLEQLLRAEDAVTAPATAPVDAGRQQLLDSLRSAMRQHGDDSPTPDVERPTPAAAASGKSLPTAARPDRTRRAQRPGNDGTRLDAPSLRIRA